MHFDPIAFHRQIAAGPDDDGPRLVYADWLEEQGDPRGEFIRAQCELDRADALTAHWHEANDVSRRLQREHGARWQRELCQRMGAGRQAGPSKFRRGFFVHFPLDVDMLEAAGRSLREATALTSIVLSQTPKALVRNTEGLQDLQELFVHCAATTRDQIFSATAPRLSRLTMRPLLANASAMAFAESAWPNSLEYLAFTPPSTRSLSKNSIRSTVTVDGPRLRGLSIGRNMGRLRLAAPHLRELRVDHTDDRLEGQTPSQIMDELTTLPLNQLRQLKLLDVDESTIQALHEHAAFERVELLHLSERGFGVLANEVRPDVCGRIQRLALAPIRPTTLQHRRAISRILDRLSPMHLRELVVGHWGPHELQAMLACQFRLEKLEFHGSHLAPEPLELDIGDFSSMANSLRQLSFRRCRLGSRMLEGLTKTRFDHLRSLSFSGANLRGVDRLLISDAFPELVSLELQHFGSPRSSSDEEAKAIHRISREADFPELRVLDISGRQLRLATIRELLHSPRFPKLLCLRVHNVSGMRRSSKESLTDEFGSRVDFEQSPWATIASPRHNQS